MYIIGWDTIWYACVPVAFLFSVWIACCDYTRNWRIKHLYINSFVYLFSLYILYSIYLFIYFSFTEGHVLEPGLSNEKHPRDLSNKSMQDDTSISINSHETETHSMLACSVELLSNTLVLLCSVDSLRLYRMKSLIQVHLLPC